MRSALPLILSVVLGLFVSGAEGKCSNSPLPYLTGKSLLAYPSCGVVKNGSSTTLRVEEYGIFFSDMFPWPAGNSSTVVCAHEMVVIYTKKDKAAYILNRPSVTREYFSGGGAANNKKSCARVPVEKVTAWGERKLFISLIRKAIKISLYIRDFNCDNYRQPKNTVIMRDPKDVSDILERHRVANAAIDYLYATAYTNFFCL